MFLKMPPTSHPKSKCKSKELLKGEGALNPWVVADAILKEIREAALKTPLQRLSTVRIVMIKINIFLEFKRCLQTLFGVSQARTASRGQLQGDRLQASPKPELRHLMNPGLVCPSVKLLVIGLSHDAVASAEQKLRQAYTAQCSQKGLSAVELERLTQGDLAKLASMMEELGVQAEPNKPQLRSVLLSGFKDGVEKVYNHVQTIIKDDLLREVQEKKQEDMYARIAWCLQQPKADWQRFPQEANFLLETKKLGTTVKDAKGMEWTIDLGKMEARSKNTYEVAKLKRLENLSDFVLPLYWDNMPPGKFFQTGILEPSSFEYQWASAEFSKTVSRTIIKIERIQNIHLRRGYEGLKKQIEDKNGSLGAAMERTLFHGTTSEACEPIQRNGFSRSFAGQNATHFGMGVYFAVSASFSANPIYSVPAADGSQCMFLARVLTGQYTMGNKNMKVPPLRSPLQSDRYDSVVDNVDNPTLFVVFHDSQAYPDYLITFK